MQGRFIGLVMLSVRTAAHAERNINITAAISFLIKNLGHRARHDAYGCNGLNIAMTQVKTSRAEGGAAAPQSGWGHSQHDHQNRKNGCHRYFLPIIALLSRAQSAPEAPDLPGSAAQYFPSDAVSHS